MKKLTSKMLRKIAAQLKQTSNNNDYLILTPHDYFLAQGTSIEERYNIIMAHPNSLLNQLDLSKLKKTK